MKKSTLIFITLSLLFFGFGIMTFQDAIPKKKEERIYIAISKHFPYIIEKRLGGLTIIFKDTNEKMKPTNSEFFSKIESIDKFWAKEYLILTTDKVIILDKNKINECDKHICESCVKIIVENVV